MDPGVDLGGYYGSRGGSRGLLWIQGVDLGGYYGSKGWI